MLEFAAEKNNIEIEAIAYHKLGLFYQWTGIHRDLLKSNYYFKKAYKLSLELNNSFQIECLNSLSVIAEFNAEYYEEVDFLNKTHDLAKKMNSNTRVINSFIELADLYTFPFSDFKKADKLLNEALSYKRILHSFDLIEWRVYRKKGINYLYQEEYNQAQEYFVKADKINIKWDFAIYLNSKFLGLASYLIKDYNKAKEHFDEAIKMMQLSNAVRDDPDLATLYFLNEFKLGNFESTSDSILNPMSSKMRKTTFDNFAEDIINSDTKEWVFSIADGKLFILYYNIYKIYTLEDHTEESKIFINLAYEEIMKTGSKLNNKDKNRFLKENKFVSEIIKDWEKLD